VLGAMLRASILDLAQYGPAYRERMQGIVQRVDNYFPPTSSAVQIPAGKIAGEAGQLRDTAHFADQLLRDGVAKLTQELIRLLSSSVVVLIYVFFLLLGASDVSAPNPTWREIEEKIRSYLSLKTVISVLTGIAFGLALWLFGVPMALTFGLLAFLLNYIPSIGPLIASLLPIPFIVLHPEPNFVWMAGVILVTSGIQVVSGNVVEPRIMGRSFDLHPVVVLLALMF